MERSELLNWLQEEYQKWETFLDLTISMMAMSPTCVIGWRGEKQ
jgi:hypothetical protein